jgi:hypothetical protein
MKTATGFLSRLTKDDEAEVAELMRQNPTWRKTYARRIVAQRKFYRKFEAAGSNGKNEKEVIQ